MEQAMNGKKKKERRDAGFVLSAALCRLDCKGQQLARQTVGWVVVSVMVVHEERPASRKYIGFSRSDCS